MEETLKIKKTDVKMYAIVKFPFYPDHPEKGYNEPIFVAVHNHDNELIANRVVRLEWDAVIVLPKSYKWDDLAQSNKNALVLYHGYNISDVLYTYEMYCPMVANTIFDERELYSTLLK